MGDRLVSEYNYRVTLSRQRPYLVHDSDIYIWHTPYPLCSAESVNDFVQHFVRKYLAGTQHASDCHFIPQAAYIWRSDGSVFCDKIIRLDQLSSSVGPKIE